MRTYLMSLSVFFRLLLSPFLLPLSVLYGFMACLFAAVQRVGAVKLKSPLISVGNFCVGGSGKTPVVEEILLIVKKRNKTPVVISKSYKASTQEPVEVLLSSDPSVVGDEAFLLKSKFPEVSVFSGPVKKDVALFAERQLFKTQSKVFILDDGAQHHKLKKGIKIHIWDMTRPLIDIFPFPFGRSREFWFLGEKPDLTIFNRSEQAFTEKCLRALVRPRNLLEPTYRVVSIQNAVTKESLEQGFTLISGLGNFKQLSDAVQAYVVDKSYGVNQQIRGRDHDSFDWFTAEDNVNYVCTGKDMVKLIDKVKPEFLFLVESQFDESFKSGLEGFLKNRI